MGASHKMSQKSLMAAKIIIFVAFARFFNYKSIKNFKIMKKVFVMILMASAMIALTTTGCDKKKHNEGGDPIKKMLPSEIIIIQEDFNCSAKISYDSKNRITNVGYYEKYVEGMLEDEATYVYDSSGRLTNITMKNMLNHYSKHKSISFEYVENFVSTHIEGAYYTTKYELQGDRIIKAYEIVHGEENLLGTYTYDSKGNMIGLFSEYLSCEGTITYENKNGIYSGINMPNWFLDIDAIMPDYILSLHAVNNPLLESIITQGNGFVYTDVISYNYETYNNNYPEKFTITET